MKYSFRRTAVVNLMVFASGLGCQDSLTTCRITESDCQDDVYLHVLGLRGDGYDPYASKPPIRVISEEQFRQMLLDEPRTLNPWDAALTLLHFQDGSRDSSIDEQVANIAAYYSTATKGITIISHPSRTGPEAENMAMITLAHEFVHSLQDHVFDLTKSDHATSDAYLAYNTLIEGDARFYELLFANELLGLGYTQSNIVSVLDSHVAYDYQHLDEYGSAFFTAQMLVYSLGARYQALQYSAGGNAAVRHGYGNAPRRTLGFLDSPASADQALHLRSECEAPESSLAPSRSGGVDEFGALLFYTFMREWNVSHPIALATARSWVADSIRVQTTDDPSATAAAWRIELSAPIAPEIVPALSATGELAVDASGNRLLITVTDSESPLTWTPTADCQ